MSPALPQVSGGAAVRALEAAGFEHRSTKGSHAKLRHVDGRVVIVPCIGHSPAARSRRSSGRPG